MKKQLTILFLFTINLSLITNHCNAEDKKKIDSLKALLKTAGQDTNRANILYDLSRKVDDYNTYVDYANQCLALSEKLDFKKGMANAYRILGVSKKEKKEYAAAIDYYNKSLKIKIEINDYKGQCRLYKEIGEIYNDICKYPEALQNYLALQKIAEKIGDKNYLYDAFIDIGIIYSNQKKFTEANNYFKDGLKINEEIGNKTEISTCLIDIALNYYNQGNISEALKNYEASLKIAKEINNPSRISINLLNMSACYLDLKEYDKALQYCLEGLKIAEENKIDGHLALLYTNIGTAYTRQKKFNDAKINLDKALTLSKEREDIDNLIEVYKCLAELDSCQGKFKEAWENYKLSVQYKDSIFNEENTKKLVQTQMLFDFDKKEAATKSEQDKKDSKQRIIRNSIAGVLLLSLIFLVIALIQRNRIKKQKKRAEEEKQRAEQEKQRSDDLLLNILPLEVAEELKSTGHSRAKAFTMVTVMFTDFKDFTKVSEKISAELLVDEIHQCFSAFDAIIQKYKIEKIKTIGDAYLCASGLPVSSYTHATDMVKAAIEICHFMSERKKEKEAKGEIPFELRVGIHTGPVVAGIVGVKKYAYDIWGDTVNIAARMEQNSEAGKINISGSTYELVKDKFNCEHRGKIEAKNKGMIDMYFVCEQLIVNI